MSREKREGKNGLRKIKTRTRTEDEATRGKEKNKEMNKELRKNQRKRIKKNLLCLVLCFNRKPSIKIKGGKDEQNKVSK